MRWSDERRERKGRGGDANGALHSRTRSHWGSNHADVAPLCSPSVPKRLHSGKARWSASLPPWTTTQKAKMIRSVTSRPLGAGPEKGAGSRSCPPGTFFAPALEKAALSAGGKAGVRAWGPAPRTSGLAGRGGGGLEARAGDLSTISSHSRKAIYFLMALALSHEAGTLSFKGTESSLLPHPAGSLKSSPEFQGDHCKTATSDLGLWKPGGRGMASFSCKHQTPRANGPD